MKTPEEYLKLKTWSDTESFGNPFWTERQVTELLKSMQKDHEKELIELKEKLSNTEGWLAITKASRRTWKKRYEELLT